MAENSVEVALSGNDAQAVGYISQRLSRSTALEQALAYYAIRNGGSLKFSREQYERAITAYGPATIDIEITPENFSIKVTK